jgi:hypothetical protein
MNIFCIPTLRLFKHASSTCAVALCSLSFATASAFAQTTPPPGPIASVSGLLYSGTGCPAGTATAEVGPLGNYLFIKFPQFKLTPPTNPNPAALSKNCSFEVMVQPPAGYKIAVHPAHYLVGTSASTTAASLAVGHSWAGNPAGAVTWTVGPGSMTKTNAGTTAHAACNAPAKLQDNITLTIPAGNLQSASTPYSRYAISYVSCTPPTSIVQAVSEAISSTAGTAGSTNVRANDTAPAGSTYALAAGSTCSPVSISALGVASYTAPGAGQSCTVNYTVCNSGQCSTATLTVTSAAPPVAAFTIGVAVSGLPSGASVVLHNNGGNPLSVAANGAATFSNAVPGAYAVTVATHPVGANCVVTGGAGTAVANVATIPVVCTASRFTWVPKPAGGFYDVTECVKDTVTGLIWEGKTVGGARSSGNGYTNYDDVTQAQFLNGSAIVNPTWAQVNAANNSTGYKNMVNGLSLCGSGAWRMPTSAELSALSTASGGYGSSTQTTWLPNTINYWFWSSSPYVDNAALGLAVFFGSGIVSIGARGSTLHVRLVRAGP